jgi:hypothetical protein
VNKKQLIEVMKEFPDDMEVKVWINLINYHDSGAIVPIKNIFKENGRIYIEPEDD